MSDAVRLERLRVYLNKVMSDAEIMANPRFLPAGSRKIAKHMSVNEADVAALVLELSQHLSSMTEGVEDRPRFTYEDDTLGGITVRDAETGKEKYLNVQQAASLLKLLNSPTATEQETLEKAMLESFESASRELSADDLGTSKSIFNFPWKLNESAGFAAAQYSGFGQNFTMKIVSVVDHDGNALDNIDTKALTAQARNFINEA